MAAGGVVTGARSAPLARDVWRGDTHVGVLGAVAGAAIVGIWYTVLGQMTADQESRNAFLQAEISRLDAQIKDIATLRAEIDALNARKKAVEDLQNDRNVPVYLLNELVRQTPEGVFLTSIRQTGQVVAITGIAQTNDRVSEFLRNALYNSTWLEKPDLVEIRASSAAAGTRDQRRLFDFSMRVTIKRQQAAAPAAGAKPATPPAPALSPAKAS